MGVSDQRTDLAGSCCASNLRLPDLPISLLLLYSFLLEAE
jgi:hypothetical protein